MPDLYSEVFATNYPLTLYVTRNSDLSCGLRDKSSSINTLNFSAGVSVKGQKQR